MEGVYPGERGALLQFVWNSQTGEICGRTPLSWVKIVFFYMVYYTVLALFFMLMMFMFLRTIDDMEPKYTGDNGLIGLNPGVAFRPKPNWLESSLTWFRAGEHNGNWEEWTERLEQYLQLYKDHESYMSQNYLKDCEYGSFPQPIFDQSICNINLSALFQGKCSPENNYGFKDGTPCILIKLNKIFGWVPEPYESIDEMPVDAPETIKEEFQRNVESGFPEKNNRVWIECHGKYPADKENIGPIRYYPGMGAGANWFPYLNQYGYLSPPMFIELVNPARGVLISIECQAWARYMQHDRKKGRGLGHFEILID